MINCVYGIGLSYTSPELKPRTDVRLFYLHPRLRPCGTVEQSQGTYEFKVTRYIITGVYFLTQLFPPPLLPLKSFIFQKFGWVYINTILLLFHQFITMVGLDDGFDMIEVLFSGS